MDKSEEISRLSTEIDEMQRCQRRSDNRDFYLHKYQAEKIIDSYAGDFSSLSPDNQHLFTINRGRYAFILSDYLMQVGKRSEAIRVMDEVSAMSNINLNADTMLWLNYLSQQARVRFMPYRIEKNRKNIERGYDCLIQCYILSSRNNIDLYRGISMQLLSDYLLNDSIFQLVKAYDPASIRYINEDAVPDSLLAGNMAERSLGIFLNQGDLYLTANSWRRLASCYMKIAEPEHAIQCLNNSLANPAIDTLPYLKAHISEQLSMAYAALGDKHFSDLYRNQYLDLQDSTRMDRAIEARILTLQSKTKRIWLLVGIAFGAFVLLVIVNAILVRMRKRKEQRAITNEEEIESMQEELQALRLQGEDSIRAMVEQRAHASVISGMMSLIDRMKISVSRGDYGYANELAENIEQQNTMLTQWIKLQQGKIAPRIETFDIEDVLRILRQNTSLRSGIMLDVINTEGIMVKADKTLTLFLINTLVDNARKSIADEGRITVSCTQGDTYAEICVSDTGCGMTAEQVEHIFEPKPISGGHGFGLQNCRGIIDRYRKISNIFSVCTIEAKSEVGKGTDVSFRLPRVVKAIIMALFMSIPQIQVSALPTVSQTADSIHSAYIESLADSLYHCNVNGRYNDAIEYADSCAAFMQHVKEGVVSDTLRLSIYNETAVAALAVQQWDKYRYNNYLYANLYQKITSDASLPDYCRQMEHREMVANIAMLIVLVLLMLLVPVFWFAYLRPLLKHQRNLNKQKASLRESIARQRLETERVHVLNNIMSNQLSVIKHETMYYPTRIRQMIRLGENEELPGTVNYYSRLYNMLISPLSISLQHIYPVCRASISHLLPQAQSQDVNAHDVTLLVNEDLIRYLLLLLKRRNGGIPPVATYSVVDNNTCSISFQMTDSPLSPEQVTSLFSPSTPHTDYLVMRQIVREMVDATLSYRSGISATMLDATPVITITLPMV